MNVLALQGGGCLGKGQATFLQSLEQKAGPLHEAFDLVAGTSVGCLIGACVATEVPTARINQFFDESAPKIFHANPWQLAAARLFHAAKYNPSALEAALKELLLGMTLGDCCTRFLATAVDMATGRNVYFQSYGASEASEDEVVIGPDSGMLLSDVCRASSAAQTYFPALQKGPWTFWDGGTTGCNAPDMLALIEAQQFADARSIRMLSLGAGRTSWPYKGSDLVDPGAVTALKATVRAVYACGETNEVWQARYLLGSRHIRVNPDLPSAFGIDDASPATLATIASAWKAEADRNPLALEFWNPPTP